MKGTVTRNFNKLIYISFLDIAVFNIQLKTQFSVVTIGDSYSAF